MRRIVGTRRLAALVGALTLVGVGCVAPPSPNPGATTPTVPRDRTAAWTVPEMAPACTPEQLASGNLVGCRLGYAQPQKQGFGTPPFPWSPTVAVIPWTALEAYRNAVTVQQSRDPGCAVTTELIAAIAYNESRHAYDGARLQPGGVISPPILGVATSIPNTLTPEQQARFQNTGATLQAVGATQFLPTTWLAYEPDGNGDGVSDPQNIYDDALGTAMFLCKVSRLTTDAEVRASLQAYGYRTTEMQDGIVAKAADYRDWLATNPAPTTAALATPTLTVPAGWKWLGWAYNGSAVLSSWETGLAKSAAPIGPVKAGAIVAPPSVLPLFEGFLRDLVSGGYLVKEAGSYSFRCTSNSGRKDCLGLTPSQLSMHAWGLAIDVNWSTNPERVYTGTNGASACATPMVTDFPAWAVSAAQRWGLFWGGYGWSNACPTSATMASRVNRDAHHFEFRGTPEQAAAIVAFNQANPVPPEAQPPVPTTAPPAVETTPAPAQP